MATKLFLLKQSAGIANRPNYKDMHTAAGSAAATGVVDTVASGTEIQWTNDTTSDRVIAWASRKLSSGLTLTTSDISIWASESNMSANAGGRFRVFKLAVNGTETELAGGPFNDGVEFGTAAAEMLWAGNFTDTAFAAGDRVVVKVYITNVGVMGGGFTCTLTYNAADAATGDSFFNLNENLSFSQPTARAGTHMLLGVGA